jgi:uncharacterized glyoxalase superfamily protein PhnB
MIMLGAVRDDEYGKRIAVPGPEGKVTQSAYVVIADIEAHYERAKAAGAVIVSDLEKQDYGGAAYSARDPEGHLWNFGSYDPWAEGPAG